MESSNLLGLRKEECGNITETELAELKKETAAKYINAGADMAYMGANAIALGAERANIEPIVMKAEDGDPEKSSIPFFINYKYIK